MRIAFALPSHPLLRALVVFAGGAILVALVFFGLLAGMAVAAVGALALLMRRLLPRKAPRAPRDGIIEGEFRVVDPPRARIG